jgi:hypothetical protein
VSNLAGLKHAEPRQGQPTEVHKSNLLPVNNSAVNQLTLVQVQNTDIIVKPSEKGTGQRAFNFSSTINSVLASLTAALVTASLTAMDGNAFFVLVGTGLTLIGLATRSKNPVN